MLPVFLSLLLSPTPQAPEAVLTTADASWYSSFGEATARSGNWAFVGAPDDQIAGSNYVGSVLVYENTAAGWVQRQKLTASNGALFHSFGHSIAAEGDRVAIGAPDALGNSTGSVVVFRHDGVSWVEEQILANTTGGGNDWFGWSVDLQGDRIVVGSMYSWQPGMTPGSPFHPGAAWVYRHDGVSWVLEQSLRSSDQDFYDLFGSAVAIDGNRLVVGARGEGNPIGGGLYHEGYIGAAYVFEWNGVSWVETQKLRASNFEEHAWFGYDLAIDGARILVGSPGKLGGGVYGAGEAYMFHLNAGSWAEVVKLNDHRTSQLGRSVDLEGDLAVATSYGHDHRGNDTGAIHPYRFDGAMWNAEPPVNPGGLGVYDAIGTSVDLDGSTVIAGAYLESLAYSLAPGGAFLYDLSPRFHLMVAPFPLDIAEDAKFELRHAQPNALAWMSYSLVGPGATPIPPLGVTSGLANPQQLATALASDANGIARWEMPLPSQAQGLTVWFQGLQVGQSTNLVRAEIQ